MDLTGGPAWVILSLSVLTMLNFEKYARLLASCLPRLLLVSLVWLGVVFLRCLDNLVVDMLAGVLWETLKTGSECVRALESQIVSKM